MQAARSCQLGRLILLALCQVLAYNCLGLQSELISCDEVSDSTLSFSERWDSLGPFRIGTREVVWGADPLEAHGGFINLPFDDQKLFRSPLAANASIGWAVDYHKTFVDAGVNATVHLHTEYPDIDWDGQQQAYGWSALQFQTWTRGYLFNDGHCTRRALLRPHGILEFYFNGKHVFGGDFYGFDRAPLLVELRPGRNRLDVRLFRDVRAIGGIAPPVIDASIRCEMVTGDIFTDISQLITPDLVDGNLPSLYFGIPVTNLLMQAIVIINCDGTQTQQHARLVNAEPLQIIPGQTRVITYMMAKTKTAARIETMICYHYENDDIVRQHIVSFDLAVRSINEAHKFTFLHPSGTVSYAVIKPPARNFDRTQSRPLMLVLHGAGLEADSYLVRHSLDGAPELEAFVLFPTGMGPWSADDWHIYGHSDVIAAIAAVHQWVARMQWNGTSVTTERILVAGHSNGGQGTWFFTTHQPDRTLAAIPVSGWTSIENYVPYTFWSEADPLKQAITNMARVAFKHELFINNIVDIPIMQEHGSADDNVPPYHSRLMSSLRDIFGNDSSYIEQPKQGHWFEGAMTTEPLRKVYQSFLSGTTIQRNISESFGVVSTATDEMGSKNGILVEQLCSPDRLARLNVNIDPHAPTLWHIQTVNVRRFRLNLGGLLLMMPKSLHFEATGVMVDVPSSSKEICLLQADDGRWAKQHCDVTSSERTGRQRGSLDALLRTTGPFQIIADKDAMEVGLQISRNMLQYFGADSVVMESSQREQALHSRANVITLSLAKGSKVPQAQLYSFPITFSDHGLNICLKASQCTSLSFGMFTGVVMLRPLLEERLEALVWGSDVVGLQEAARLLPTLTGAGQPDFIIIGPTMKWQGLQGALALGFFDYSWQISHASYV